MPRRIGVMLTGFLLLWLLLAGWEAAWAAEGVQKPAGADADAAGGSQNVLLEGGAQKLEEASEALYTYVLNGDVAKARQKSEEISQLFVAASFEDRTTVEGIHALSGVIMDVKSAFAAVNASPERWEAAAAKLRLAANSLNHPRQPMWLQYYKVIREDLSDLEQSAAGGDMEGWKTAISRLQIRYDNIRPAVVISRPPETVNALDAWISYAAEITSSSQPPGRTRLMEVISYGQEAVRVLFGKEKNEPALSLPLPPEEYGIWGLMGGFFIVSALVYAGYRKYRGNREEWKPI